MIDKTDALTFLHKDVQACRICEPDLKLGVNPVIQIGQQAKILIAGQAPGLKVHQSGIPFNDASGDRLRDWMGISKADFYDASKVAILPMGFCYPGKGTSGDLPPRGECATKWRQLILENMPNIKLILVIGIHAQKWHLPNNQFSSLTETVKHWCNFAPDKIPLPHPSPRNNIWLHKNPWFEKDVLPYLKAQVSALLTNK